jgi:hypothetical protein
VRTGPVRSPGSVLLASHIASNPTIYPNRTIGAE